MKVFENRRSKNPFQLFNNLKAELNFEKSSVVYEDFNL